MSCIDKYCVLTTIRLSLVKDEGIPITGGYLPVIPRAIGSGALPYLTCDAKVAEVGPALRIVGHEGGEQLLCILVEAVIQTSVAQHVQSVFELGVQY